MGIFRKTAEIRTKGLNDFVNITENVKDVIKESFLMVWFFLTAYIILLLLYYKKMMKTYPRYD